MMTTIPTWLSWRPVSVDARRSKLRVEGTRVQGTGVTVATHLAMKAVKVVLTSHVLKASVTMMLSVVSSHHILLGRPYDLWRRHRITYAVSAKYIGLSGKSKKKMVRSSKKCDRSSKTLAIFN